MMRRYSQIERLIRLLQMLSTGRKLTTEDLRTRFRGMVSRRTLQRDFLTLSSSGVPVISEKIRANENVWYIDSQFKSFIPIPLGVNEYLAAHMVKENLKVFRHTPFETEINSLIDKIGQIVPENVFMETKSSRTENIFENYGAGLFDYSPYGNYINDLISSILSRNVCQVKYFSPGNETEKIFLIEPEKLIYFNGGLYIIAFIRKYENHIILSIQRIQELSVLTDKFPADHSFDESDFWRGKFGLFPGNPVNVVLKFSRKVKHHIAGRNWHSSQEINEDEAGDLILSLNVGLSPELVTWIMGWHQNVQVLAPESLIDEIKENLSAAQKIYS